MGTSIHLQDIVMYGVGMCTSYSGYVYMLSQDERAKVLDLSSQY